MFENCPPIDEILNATEADLTSKLLCSSKPVVLRGLVNHWPLVGAARLSAEHATDYLKLFSSQQKVRAFVADAKYNGRFFYNADLTGFNFTPTTTTLENVLSDLVAYQNKPDSPGLYMGSTSVDHVLPGFRNENDLTPLSNKPLISLWVGNKSRIAAHYDVTDNIACVAAGKRRFTLFPPNQLKNLYIGPIDFTPAGQPASLVDFHQPDLLRYPRFASAVEHAQVAELNPGDAIFIPSMWWHHIEGLSSFNILVNYWWRQVEHYMGAPMDALNHALLSIKDLPQAQKDVWRDIFEYYVFSPEELEHIPEEKRGVLNPLKESMARKLRASLINKLNN